jgi:hypothetical protein
MKNLFILFVLLSQIAIGATVKPNQLPAITSAQINSAADLFMLYDNSAGMTKKILVSELDTRWGGGGSPITSVTASSPLSSTGGLTPNISCQLASGSQAGCLSATNFNTFNGKQAAGDYATSGTGDVTWSAHSGGGSVTTSILASIVTGKLLTGFSASAGTVSATDTILQAFNKIVANIALKQDAGNFITALTGDVTASGPGSSAATVASVGGSSASAVNTATIAANAAASANTLSAIVKRDSSGNFSAGTITAALTGNASTASALASNPSDCSANEFASAIAANGNLTCSNPFTGFVESYSGHIETVSDKTYVIDHYAAYAKQIVSIRAKCTSGSVTVALKIGGTNITTCNGISVTSSSASTTCDMGSTNDLAANGELTLVTSSTSTCTDFVWTIKTTRD